MRKTTNYSIQYGGTYAIPPSLPGKLGLVGVVLGLCLFLVGCCTPHWRITQSGHSGLWVNCEVEVRRNHEITVSLQVSQAMAVIALILGLLNAYMSAAYFLPNRFQGRMITCRANLLLSALAAFSVLVCLCMMGSEVHGLSYLNWSFYLALGGAVCLSIGGLLWLVQLFWL